MPIKGWNENQKVAFVMGQTVAAMAKLLGMQAENMERSACGEGMAYLEEHFEAVIPEFGLEPDQLSKILI